MPEATGAVAAGPRALGSGWVSGQLSGGQLGDGGRGCGNVRPVALHSPRGFQQPPESSRGPGERGPALRRWPAGAGGPQPEGFLKPRSSPALTACSVVKNPG